MNLNILLRFSVLIFFAKFAKGYQLDINKDHYDGLSELMMEIVLHQFPKCEVVFVGDNYFQNQLFGWMGKIFLPFHTMNLERDQHPNSTFEARHYGSITSCTTIVVCCQTNSSCQSKFLKKLFKLYFNRNSFRRIRKSFLYIQEETTNTLKPPSFYESEFDHESSYSMPLMNYAKTILIHLKSHITIIRRVEGTFRHLLKDGSPTFQLLTFTPNWIPGGSPVLQVVWSRHTGFWKQIQGCRSWGLEIKSRHIRSGKGTIRVAIPSANLLPMIQVNEDDGSATGIEAEVMKMLSDKFKIKVHYFEVDDTDFGDERKSGRWTGVIGDVIKKKADFGLGQIIFTYARRKTGLVLTTTLVVLRGAIVCSIPKELPKWLILLAPFEIYIWISLVVSVCFVLIMSNVLQNVARHWFKPRRRWGEGYFKSRTHKKLDVWLAWIYCIGPVLQRSIPEHLIPNRDGFRWFFGFWLSFCFLVSSFYGSVLISKLSLPAKEAPFDSIKDLLANGKDWTISGLVEQTLDKTIDSDERKVLTGDYDIGTANSLLNARDQREYRYAVETGNCAVAERARAEFVISNNYTIIIPGNTAKPLLRMSKESFLLGPAGWVMRSDVDYILKNYVHDLIMRFKDHGFIIKAEKDLSRHTAANTWNREKQPLDESDTDTLKSLEIESLQTVFYFWFGGLAASFLTFILELAFFSLKTMEEIKRK